MRDGRSETPRFNAAVDVAHVQSQGKLLGENAEPSRTDFLKLHDHDAVVLRSCETSKGSTGRGLRLPEPPGPCLITEEGMGLMFGLKRTAKMWREAFVAGATNTGNVTATVGNKLVLNWHGTPTQRDDALRMFPVIRDKLMPGVELGSFADAIIANIHDEGMSPDNDRVQHPNYRYVVEGVHNAARRRHLWRFDRSHKHARRL